MSVVFGSVCSGIEAASAAWTSHFVTHALRTDCFDSQVRRLTPREAERLMGFPDDYTLIPWRGGIAADGLRYRVLGNSMAVPVMRWIGRRIAAAMTFG